MKFLWLIIIFGLVSVVVVESGEQQVIPDYSPAARDETWHYHDSWRTLYAAMSLTVTELDPIIDTLRSQLNDEVPNLWYTMRSMKSTWCSAFPNLCNAASKYEDLHNIRSNIREFIWCIWQDLEQFETMGKALYTAVDGGYFIERDVVETYQFALRALSITMRRLFRRFKLAQNLNEIIETQLHLPPDVLTASVSNLKPLTQCKQYSKAIDDLRVNELMGGIIVVWFLEEYRQYVVRVHNIFNNPWTKLIENAKVLNDTVGVAYHQIIELMPSYVANPLKVANNLAMVYLLWESFPKPLIPPNDRVKNLVYNIFKLVEGRPRPITTKMWPDVTALGYENVTKQIYMDLEVFRQLLDTRNIDMRKYLVSQAWPTILRWSRPVADRLTKLILDVEKLMWRRANIAAPAIINVGKPDYELDRWFVEARGTDPESSGYHLGEAGDMRDATIYLGLTWYMDFVTRYFQMAGQKPVWGSYNEEKLLRVYN